MLPQLHCEVWIRRCLSGMEWRGMVRCEDQYLFTGEWVESKLAAAAAAESAARKLHKRDRRSVRHKP